MIELLWGEVRSACAAGLWSDAIQAIDAAARESFDDDTFETIPAAITPEQAAELLRYCARAAASAPALDAVADLSVAVLCESGEHWPWPVPEVLLWDDDGDCVVGPYTLTVSPLFGQWSWSVSDGDYELYSGLLWSQAEARFSALRAVRRDVLALVLQLF